MQGQRGGRSPGQRRGRTQERRGPGARGQAVAALGAGGLAARASSEPRLLLRVSGRDLHAARRTEGQAATATRAGRPAATATRRNQRLPRGPGRHLHAAAGERTAVASSGRDPRATRQAGERTAWRSRRPLRSPSPGSTTEECLRARPGRRQQRAASGQRGQAVTAPRPARTRVGAAVRGARGAEASGRRCRRERGRAGERTAAAPGPRGQA